MPRSLRFSYEWIDRALKGLRQNHAGGAQALAHCTQILGDLQPDQMNPIFQGGLHEFLLGFIQRNNRTSALIADEFYFQ